MRRRRGGCSGREPAGSGQKWRGWWGKWRDMGKTGGKATVSLPRGPCASDWRCRELPALPIGSCRTGAGTGAPAHLLGSPTHRRDFGGADAGRFWSRAQFPCRPRFGRRFGAAGGDALSLHPQTQHRIHHLPSVTCVDNRLCVLLDNTFSLLHYDVGANAVATGTEQKDEHT
jgi:hypothetical protein